jgi:hypothetical protein
MISTKYIGMDVHKESISIFLTSTFIELTRWDEFCMSLRRHNDL